MCPFCEKTKTDFLFRLQSCLRQLFKAEKTKEKRLRGRGLFFTVVLFPKLRHDTNKLDEKFVRLLQLLLLWLLNLLLLLQMFLLFITAVCCNRVWLYVKTALTFQNFYQIFSSKISVKHFYCQSFVEHKKGLNETFLQ